MGDPSGIGPEIILKTLLNPLIYEKARPLIIGASDIIQRTASLLNIKSDWNSVPGPEEGCYKYGTIDIFDLDNINRRQAPFGKITADGGRASFEYIETAVSIALKNKASVATAPINKESLKAAGVPYIGHTEIFGGLCGVKNPLTMFETQGLRIFFLSRHMSLRNACDYVKKEAILEFIPRCLEELDKLGIKKPTLAIAGLNPHCGEHGLFGEEEVREIEPAVTEAREKGLPVFGPIGADSVFHLVKSGQYSAVLSLYHDQGHIAAKTLNFEKTISLTLGIPIVRTSVDHGTAFDIAGTGTASPVSMTEAVLLAANYSHIAS